MPRVCLFDSATCNPVPSIKNGGKEKFLELKDSFSVNGKWVTLKDFFSKDYSKTMSPKMRLQQFLLSPELKFQRVGKGQYTITVDGKDLKISPELFKYAEEQELGWRRPQAFLKPPRRLPLPPLGRPLRQIFVLLKPNPFYSKNPSIFSPSGLSRFKKLIHPPQTSPNLKNLKRVEDLLRKRVGGEEPPPK